MPTCRSPTERQLVALHQSLESGLFTARPQWALWALECRLWVGKRTWSSWGGGGACLRKVLTNMENSHAMKVPRWTHRSARDARDCCGRQFSPPLTAPAPWENRKDMSPFMSPFCRCFLRKELCRKHALTAPQKQAWLRVLDYGSGFSHF